MMGYYATTMEQKLDFECESEKQVIDHLDAAGLHLQVWEATGSRPAETIHDVLSILGFEDNGGGDLYFNAKWRDQDDYFRALAPFLKDGSYIRFQGEDAAMWGYRFEAGTMKDEVADIVWR